MILSIRSHLLRSSFPSILLSKLPFAHYKMSSSSANLSKNGNGRREIAKMTISVVEAETYDFQGTTYDLKDSLSYMKDHTAFYPANSAALSTWNTPDPERPKAETKITLLEGSTLEGTFQLAAEVGSDSRVGVLNFASAKNPGGGWQTGAQAQVRTKNILPMHKRLTSR